MFHKLKCFQNAEIDILWNERESRHDTFDVVCKWDQIPQTVLFVVAVLPKLIRLKCANHHQNDNQG